MRIRIHHETTYSYDRPAQSMVQLLRLTPRDHEGQYVRRWRIDVDDGGILRQREDAFGNVLHVLSANGRFSTFSLSVDRPNVLVGIIIGASVVFFFSGLLIMAVGRAAGQVGGAGEGCGTSRHGEGEG